MVPLFKLAPQLSEDCLTLGDFPLCRLLLLNDANYPWFILVPRVDGVEEVFELSCSQQQQLTEESALLAKVLKVHFSGEKMNVAALGNMVRQLHIHHIVRYRDDLAWPGPVWGHSEARPYDQQAARAICEGILPLLGDSFQPVSGGQK